MVEPTSWTEKVPSKSQKTASVSNSVGDMAREYTHGPERSPSALAARLDAGLFVLDGATGSELERRGIACALPLWSAQGLLEAPDLVERIHRDYAHAGVDCLTANSFRTQHHVLRRAGLGERASELTALAIELARRAAAERPDVWVAGSAPTLEDCYRPDLVPDDATLEREHARHCEALVAGGADLILVETMGTTRETRAAASAAVATGLPLLVSWVGSSRKTGTGTRPDLLSGEPLEAAIDAVAPFAPAGLLMNCIAPSRVDAYLPTLRASGLPFGCYPNLGEPGPDPRDAYSEAIAPEAFAERARHWVSEGARVVGGCCGTRPDHLRAVCSMVRAS